MTDFETKCFFLENNLQVQIGSDLNVVYYYLLNIMSA